MVDINSIQHFTRVLGTVSHMAKTCALRMTPTKLYFILADNAALGGVSIWCELIQSNFFEEYRIEGKEESNNIYLELIPENLMRAMKSASSAQAVKIKLTKKHAPCLTFEITLPSLTSHTRSVVHDVPVGVIPERDWEDYKEPAMPEFDVSIYMPSLTVVKNVIERMKNLSNFLILAANQNGYMTLGIDTDLASVTTHFKNLDTPTWGDTSSQQRNRDPDKMAEARVDVKKLATFLHSQQVSPNRVICNIVHGKAVQFLLLNEDLSLQYVIPAVSL